MQYGMMLLSSWDWQVKAKSLTGSGLERTHVLAHRSCLSLCCSVWGQVSAEALTSCSSTVNRKTLACGFGRTHILRLLASAGFRRTCRVPFLVYSPHLLCIFVFHFPNMSWSQMFTYFVIFLPSKPLFVCGGRGFLEIDPGSCLC